MKRDDLTAAMRRMKVETGSLICLGCGYECSCSIHGCRILREAADTLENDAHHIQALQRDAYGLRRLLQEYPEVREVEHDGT